MSELPDNVDLNWIGRRLIAISDDLQVLAAIVRRIDNTLAADRGEWRTLFNLERRNRDRIEAIEARLDRPPITDTD